HHLPTAGRPGGADSAGVGGCPRGGTDGARGAGDRRRGAGAGFTSRRHPRGHDHHRIPGHRPGRPAGRERFRGNARWTARRAARRHRRPAGPRGRGRDRRVSNAAEQTFGPTALATPANALTAARLLATPVFVGLIVTQGATWLTVVVGVAVAGSDGVDGWLARRQGTTRSGAFLDPLADKAVVLGAMFALAVQGHLPWAPVGLIALREIGLVVYRSWAGRRGVSIPA